MKNRKKQISNQLRIIGGEWRGRKLPFADIEGLRPTPDRVRETLFNWLQPYIIASRCLDLYAGSGALGLEALSRGANHVTMLDNQNKVTRQLKENAQLLKTHKAEIFCQSALDYLALPCRRPFQIVFVDPPYRKDIVRPTCQLLETNNWLSDGAMIYLEVETELTTLPIPDNWKILRSKQAGQVRYHLLQRHAIEETP